MTKIEKQASDYSYENYIDYVDSWGEECDTFHDTKEAFIDGAEWMLERVITWLKFNTDWDYEWDEHGRNPNFGKIGELRKDMEE